MSRYVEILARQRPFPFAVDENARTIFSCNFDAMAAAPVGSWEEELARLISDAGGGTLGVDMFVGPAAVVPTGAGPYVGIVDTGGVSPDETHDAAKYERLSAQVVVRAANYSTARTRALLIWRALDGLRNTTVTP